MASGVTDWRTMDGDSEISLSLSPLHLTVFLPLLLLTSCFAYNVTYELFFSPLAAFPGPKTWACSGIPQQIHSLRGDAHTVFLSLFNRYGPVVRIAPNELIFNSAQAVRDIHSTLHHQGGKKNVLPKDERNYAGWALEEDSILTAMDHGVHARQRRMLSTAFSERSVREQEPMVLDHIQKFIAGLRREGVEKGKEVDIKTWFNFVTFDITGYIIYGESFHCLDNSNLHPRVALMTENVKAQILVGMMLRIPGMKYLTRFIMSKEEADAMNQNRALAKASLDARLEQDQTSNKADLIGLMMKNGMSKGKGGISNGEDHISYGELHANTSIFISAGSETSATTLTACIYYLTKNPDKYARLVSEIRSAFPSSSNITSTTAAKLPYLTAVIQESLRIFPPVVNQMHRKTPPSGATIDNHFVPGNTYVGFPHYAAYHSPSNFSSPEDFLPERWISGGEADKKETMQAFSLGPYGCLGITLAWMEMRLILCFLLWEFDVLLCEGQEKWEEQEVFLIWMKPPLRVRVVERRG